VRDSHIRLAHGNGGRFMRELIENVFTRQLANRGPDTTLDASPFELPHGIACITTDAFTVKPVEFPGGSIGTLAVNGTVNDLAVAGARPYHLTLSAIIEEGLEIATLERIVASLSEAARTARVTVLAGDTKVVPRGNGGGIYFATTGIGVRPPHATLGLDLIREGDIILCSGPIGDHGIAVMLAREDFDIRGDIRSDCAPVIGLAEAALAQGVRFMRDPTRGGLASVANEICAATRLGLRLIEDQIPVRNEVRAVCDMLGYDPYYLACEGRIIAVAPEPSALAILDAWRQTEDGAQAAIIGSVTAGPARVVLETSAGGARIMDELEEDPLPRIC
jgi:hydrogenase expression/formation protein HypE